MAFSLIGWIAWLLIGIVVGGFTHVTLQTRQQAWYTVLVAVLGAFFGGFLASQFGVSAVTDFSPWSLVAALVGSVLFVLLMRLLDRGRIRAITPADSNPLDDGTPTSTNYAVAHKSKLSTKRHRLSPVVLLLGVLLLPVLDVLLLRLRLPDVTAAPPPFGMVETYRNEFGQLEYVVHTPPQYSSGTALPLLVLLHGCMQNPAILEAASGMTAIADANNFLLVYPQQNAASSPHRCWNWYDKRNQQRESGEPALIAGIVNQIQQNYTVDNQRIYVAGISSGGAMTSILGSCYPDLFAAAAVHSGMAYESATSVFEALLAPLRGNQVPPDVAGRNAYACSGTESRVIPLLVLHGTADSIVTPINAAHTLEQFAQTNDFADDAADNDTVRATATNVETGQVENGYAYTVEDFEYNGDRLMQRYTVDGLWHMWSGGTGTYPLSDPKAPNASEIIWNFVSAYRLEP